MLARYVRGNETDDSHYLWRFSARAGPQAPVISLRLREIAIRVAEFRFKNPFRARDYSQVRELSLLTSDLFQCVISHSCNKEMI
jgi:hypothetical protein